jgi:Spy/CpxP family protein refolding chaperone
MIRKHIVVLGAAIALFAASEATAQAPAQPDSARRQGEARRERARGERGQKMRRAGAKGLFRGIDLTQAQHDQMKPVNEKYQAQFQTLRESLAPDLKAAKEARQRGDTVAARAAWERTNAGRERMRTLMEQQRTEVRALLTPEQQQTFDKNAQQMHERMEKRAGNRQGRAHGRRRA